jgi:hypothetical protein
VVVIVVVVVASGDNVSGVAIVGVKFSVGAL